MEITAENEWTTGDAGKQWTDWRWQMRASLKTEADFARHFDLTEDERRGFQTRFAVRCTPYYMELAHGRDSNDPIRKIVIPTAREVQPGLQQMLDPLGEREHNPAPRVIHRYPDRALFLVTDTCSVYCRYCTRKHFTASDQAFVRSNEYAQALEYFRQARGLREVILSGGDPLTLGDDQLLRVIEDLRAIPHIDLIRIGTRMPVVCPMRVTPELVSRLKQHHPVFIMTHFNHPREITAESSQALTLLVDNGFPVFNQLVLLNGVNNHPVIVEALSRRLLRLRVKPYYMFQCDPSHGTDHLRTSVEDSLAIQKALWGRISGLAMPSLSLDIPAGGGKVGLVPNFETARGLTDEGFEVREYVGWDGKRGEYKSPRPEQIFKPTDVDEWRS